MNTRSTFRLVFSSLVVALLVAAQPAPTVNPLDRLLRMSDDEKVRLAKSLIDRGLPPWPEGDPGGGLGTLARNRSALILPLIEAKLEEALRASNPLDVFTDKTANPEAILIYLRETITQVGDKQALLEASKLLKIDEKRFDNMVVRTMQAAYSRNPFKLAYQGFEIGDPAIDKRLLAWVEKALREELDKIGNPVFEKAEGYPRRRWAEALVDRYGGEPSPAQWMNDPIASHLGSIPEMALLERDVRRFTLEIAEKRARKK